MIVDEGESFLMNTTLADEVTVNFGMLAEQRQGGSKEVEKKKSEQSMERRFKKSIESSLALTDESRDISKIFKASNKSQEENAVDL
jgi:hypothetical protein